MEEFKIPSLPIALRVEKPTKDGIKSLPPETPEEEELQKTTPATNSKPPAQNCPYKVPLWSNSVPNDNRNYSFEVLKSGQIIDEVKHLQSKAYWTFGRLPENDIEMAHPTISRFHAVLQYRPKSDTQSAEDGESDNKDDCNTKGPPEGWYIYDLDSTHGTFVNKQRVPPKVYIRIRVGHILRLGASTRSYILQGPPEDEEPESELTITEIKAKRQQNLEEAALEKKRLADAAEEKVRNEGCGWGMGDDADEETDLTHNPYASTNNEELFLDDPKKTLRGYFEREGLELEYKCDEMSAGSFVCRVELPLDNDNGRPIIAEVVHKGKKKDCVVQCALEACRILDRHGVLRQANQEPLKRKQKCKDSDSDDDEFWDRTGDVARKKQRKANVSTSVTLTYDDLLKQEIALTQQLKQVESNIVAYQEQQRLMKAEKQQEEQGDDLDSYMENLQAKEPRMDKTEIKKLRLEELRLKTELQRNQRLLKIAKPVDLPFGRNPLEDTPNQQIKNVAKNRQLPMIGKRNQFSKFKIIKPADATTTYSKTQVSLPSDEEEVEDNDNDIMQPKTLDEMTSKPKIQIQNVFETHEDSEMKVKTLEKYDTEHPLAQDPTKLSNDETEEPTTKNDNQSKKDIVEQSIESSIKSPKEPIKLAESNLDKTSEKSALTDSAESGKKRRNRHRHRGKRQEVDMDDDVEYESTEKYAKWVPPENQTGDGFTELNKKFGY